MIPVLENLEKYSSQIFAIKLANVPVKNKLVTFQFFINTTNFLLASPENPFYSGSPGTATEMAHWRAPVLWGVW